MNLNKYIEGHSIELTDVLDFMRFTFVDNNIKYQRFLIEDGGLTRPIFIILIRDWYGSIGTVFLSMRGSPPRVYATITNNYFLVFNIRLDRLFFVRTIVDLAPLTIEEKPVSLSLLPNKVKAFNFVAYPNNFIKPINLNKYKDPEIFTIKEENPLIVPPKSLCKNRFLKIKEIKTVKEFKKCVSYIQKWRECNF